MNPLRDELDTVLDHLDEAQTRQLLAIARILYDAPLDENYREEDDPFIKGIFHDSPDLAIQSEEILQEQLARKFDKRENDK